MLSACLRDADILAFYLGTQIEANRKEETNESDLKRAEYTAREKKAEVSHNSLHWET